MKNHPPLIPTFLPPDCICPRTTGGPWGDDTWLCNRPGSPGCQKARERAEIARPSTTTKP